MILYGMERTLALSTMWAGWPPGKSKVQIQKYYTTEAKQPEMKHIVTTEQEFFLKKKNNKLRHQTLSLRAQFNWESDFTASL